MESIFEFIRNNYLIFTIISVILILALIGYTVDSNVGKDVKIKKKKDKKVVADAVDSIEKI